MISARHASHLDGAREREAPVMTCKRPFVTNAYARRDACIWTVAMHAYGRASWRIHAHLVLAAYTTAAPQSFGRSATLDLGGQLDET